MHTYTYLALGDSYTIGEAVEIHKSFPYQTVQMLRKKGFAFLAPEIIAKTGWTTEELEASLKGYQFLNKYDFVTLLIGVNNQYRGQTAISYKEQFEELLKKALALANNKKDRLVVISIPDYSISPFATELDKEKIAGEIDVFNTINRAISVQYKVRYLDITPDSRESKSNPSLFAQDGLHPAAEAYTVWAEKLAELIVAEIK
jgi:lysophospholipase L1-like esterase